MTYAEWRSLDDVLEEYDRFMTNLAMVEGWKDCPKLGKFLTRDHVTVEGSAVLFYFRSLKKTALGVIEKLPHEDFLGTSIDTSMERT